MGSKPVAIIPARGGSKRIPHKNIRPFLGRPIIEYPIQAALETGLFEKVIVSTDSEEIAKVAKSAGAEAPFIRPGNLADDFSTAIDVLVHAAQWLRNGPMPEVEYICQIYATAPLLKAEIIKQGYDKIVKNDVSSVFGVVEFDFPILRSLRINDTGHLYMQWPEHELSRSNDLPKYYHDAGQFSWLQVDPFLVSKKVYTKDAMPIVLPASTVQDIDTLEDWHLAEIKYSMLAERIKSSSGR